MIDKKLTWKEIKEKYPHRYVALTDIEYGINELAINKARVMYTDMEKPYEELIVMAIKGDFYLRYTTPEEDEIII